MAQLLQKEPTHFSLNGFVEIVANLSGKHRHRWLNKHWKKQDKKYFQQIYHSLCDLNRQMVYKTLYV